jgi:hypothetical protein
MKSYLLRQQESTPTVPEPVRKKVHRGMLFAFCFFLGVRRSPPLWFSFFHIYGKKAGKIEAGGRF